MVQIILSLETIEPLIPSLKPLRDLAERYRCHLQNSPTPEAAQVAYLQRNGLVETLQPCHSEVQAEWHSEYVIIRTAFFSICKCIQRADKMYHLQSEEEKDKEEEVEEDGDDALHSEIVGESWDEEYAKKIAENLSNLSSDSCQKDEGTARGAVWLISAPGYVSQQYLSRSFLLQLEV